MTRQKKCLLVSCLTLSLSSLSCAAQAAEHKTWYIGGSVSTAHNKVGGADNKDWKGNKNIGIGLRAGYLLNDYVGVELGLATLGHAKRKQAGAREQKYDATAINTNVIGFLPLSERFSLLGTAGLSHIHAKQQLGGKDNKINKWTYNVGVGALYQVSDAWYVRAQYTQYGKVKWKQQDASLQSQVLSLGVDYRF